MHDILGRQRASVALCLDVGRKSQSSPGLPESIPKARQTAREQMLDEIKATAMHRNKTLDLTRMGARFQKQKTERERDRRHTQRDYDILARDNKQRTRERTKVGKDVLDGQSMLHSDSELPCDPSGKHEHGQTGESGLTCMSN